MKKKILSLLLAVVMMVSLLPTSVLAEEVHDVTPPASMPQSLAGDAAGTKGSATHKYVTNIKLKPAAQAKGDMEFIPNYSFDQAITDYQITLYNTAASTLLLSVDAESAKDGKLGYETRLDGEYTQPIDSRNPKPKSVVASKTNNISCPLVGIPKAAYGQHTLSVRVGKLSSDKKYLTDYDEYVYTFNFLPAFGDTTLQLKVAGEKDPLTLTPDYSKGARYFSDTFATVFSGDTVTITAKYRDNDKNTKCYIGDSTQPLSVDSWDSDGNASITVNVKLSDYTGSDDFARIPLRLVYTPDDGQTVESTTYVKIINSENVKPSITQQPQNVVCGKGETPTLSVNAACKTGDLTYQWYSGRTMISATHSPIKGATSSSYTLTPEDTGRAGTWYYRCDVTAEVDGQKITVSSNAVSVETTLSYVSPPNILKELGSFVSTKNEKFASGYKTEYHNGEKFDLMYISVEEPEDGVTLSYKYYSGQENNFETAKELAVTSGSGWVVTEAGQPRSKTHIITSVKPNAGFAGGTYYIWCVVTASAEDGRSATSTSGPVQLTFSPLTLDKFTKGSGTAEDPYLIENEADFVKIREYVYAGQWCAGVCFKMANDVTLSTDWTPIGGENPALKDPTTGREIQAFSGVLDGSGHTLRVATGGKPLFNYVSDAIIRNLNIYGEKINGNGLIDKFHADYGKDGNYWTGVPDCVRLENVRLLKGSSTLRSGFMEGSGSGANTITIVNCTVEAGVTIGYDKKEDNIGSFVGALFNGQIDNSVSYADVYGRNKVGGLAGKKGQSMGLCVLRNSGFCGTITASGKWVGGLIAGGYVSDSAPNTMPVSFINCYAAADISGADYVGGLFGGEEGLKAAMNPAYLKDSFFYGKLSSNGEHIGGIIGWYEGVNVNQHIGNNYYYETTGKKLNAIGGVGMYSGLTDDEKANFIANSGVAKTVQEFKDGTVLNLLNNSGEFKNWIQSEKYPVISDKPVVYELVATGATKQHYIGDTLDLTGISLTATWTNGDTTTIPLNDPDLKITGFDSSKRGQQTVTLAYGAATAQITVTVLQPAGADITVTFSLLGDTCHGDEGERHTLADGNLEKWIDSVQITVGNNATALDVIAKALGNQYTIYNASGNYIQGITPAGKTKLAEFSNGNLSGWMFTLNGVHGNLGVAEQYLDDGDVIVLHYTDDYNKEFEADNSKKKTAEEVITMIAAIGPVDLTKGAAIIAARAAYDKLTDAEKKLVTNYKTLTDAEAAYAKLAAEQGKKLGGIYQSTGDYMSKLGTPSVGSVGGEWMVLGLARSGRTVPAGYYDAVLKYVKEHADANGRLDRSKSTDNSRLILALTAMGKDVTNVGGHNLLKGLDNMAFIKKQGINGPIWALIALDSHNYPTSGDVTRDKLVQTILDAALPGGGWTLSGDAADPDMTAMAIQSLAPYYKTNQAVKAAVDKALTVLSGLQQNDGGFASWGTTNSESCAQVIVALTALGIDPAGDSRFVKNGLSPLDALCSFAVEGGGFKHTADGERNGMATEQGYYALAAYQRFANGQTGLYDMSDVTIQANGSVKPGAEPTTPKTGDTGVLAWIVAMPAAALAAALVIGKKKREA